MRFCSFLIEVLLLKNTDALLSWVQEEYKRNENVHGP